jgi:hypothetical protein
MKSIAAIFVVFAASAFCQRVFNPADPHDEFKPSVKGMAQRLAASDYVVVGTVLKVDAPLTRAYKSQLAEIEKLEAEGRITDAMEKSRGLIQEVSLFSSTIRLESTLCRKSDFLPGTAPVSLPFEIYLLTTLTFQTDADFREERLQPGHRYLFSLTTAADLATKLDNFDLDRQQLYFEILNHSDGAVELPSGDDKGKPFKPAGYKSDKDLATPIRKAATALCAAVKPAGISEKLTALQRLKSSRDPSMRENADTAIKLLGGSR